MPSEANKMSTAEDLQDQVMSQLRLIEVSHEVTIANLVNVAKIIITNVSTKSEALKVCTAINTWISINSLQGSIVIPEPLVRKYIKKIVS
ncbi:MAG: hypothetical protein LUP95_06215 [Euryarchaeota archaeon]|nr:hypothetical protein [Euryarchaeota archaeon]